MPSLFKQTIHELQPISPDKLQPNNKSKFLIERMRNADGSRYKYYFKGRLCVLIWNSCENCRMLPHYHVQKLGSSTCKEFNPRYFELEISFERENL